MREYREFWSKMFVWNASATRRQFWIPYLINFVIIIGISLLTGINFDPENITSIQALVGHNFVASLIFFIFWLADFTIRARRLHDTNRSNWWILMDIIPVIGNIWVLVLLLLPSKSDTRWPDNQSNV
ncbi:DUF805 domain-containing protein [Lacticaseibacillus brantae]|uniref:DUF805 domain-containing protein n=1 Tax=Lacticaseibacillus brantae DSM 23927 TaxID=1423727 RepID=A0A0R2AX86_9LACO|nr:DUF805 domain-containing protein [Lacticaseibacillus brantae]KRM71917.1 hypothetical protein FC34_GL000896 [Lacticaseibacillus brantae DSM 23927]